MCKGHLFVGQEALSSTTCGLRAAALFLPRQVIAAQVWKWDWFRVFTGSGSEVSGFDNVRVVGGGWWRRRTRDRCGLRCQQLRYSGLAAVQTPGKLLQVLFGIQMLELHCFGFGYASRRLRPRMHCHCHILHFAIFLRWSTPGGLDPGLSILAFTFLRQNVSCAKKPVIVVKDLQISFYKFFIWPGASGAGDAFAAVEHRFW